MKYQTTDGIILSAQTATSSNKRI